MRKWERHTPAETNPGRDEGPTEASTERPGHDPTRLGGNGDASYAILHSRINPHSSAVNSTDRLEVEAELYLSSSECPLTRSRSNCIDHH